MDKNELLPLLQQIEILPFQPAITPTISQQTNFLEATLDTFYPERHLENKAVIQTKKVLGTVAEGLTALELQTIATEVQYLIESWLDEFEKETFDGQTLHNLFKEG